MSLPSTTIADLQLLLLDLVSPARAVSQDRLDVLSDPDWEIMLKMMQQHRLAPLLHWQLSRAHAHLQCPESVKNQLLASYQKSVLRNLMVQRELLLVHDVLHSAGIPCIALKGAFLAFYAYPNAALRPLRDLDILVSAEHVLQAFQVLLDGGLTRIETYQGSPQAFFDLAEKHLPPLRSPSGTLNIELHHRLFHQEDGDNGAPDLSEEPGFWQRTVELRLTQAMIRYESPTDLLFHLIVHAAYEHEFNNGPLLLSDLAFLLDTQAIDWPLFWALAESSRKTRGCWLALKLTERYWGEKSIAWMPSVATPSDCDAQMEHAAHLMLRDFDARHDVARHATIAEKSTLFAKAAHMLGGLFVPKAVLAVQYPVRQDDWWIYFYHPLRWWRLLTKTLPRFLNVGKVGNLQHEAVKIRGLRQWLQQEPH